MNNERDIFDYFELIDNAKTKKERDIYINQALLLDPENLDLLLIKNEEKKRNQDEYLAGLEEIVAIGNKQMQEGGYFKNSKGEFWLVFETRPYMSACYDYLTALMMNGFVTRAIKECERLLELCEDDNLGIRYDLMHLCALTENRERAEKLQKQYKEDYSTQMKLPLCFLYYKIGETEKAEKLLLETYKFNKDLLKFVKKILADKIYEEFDKLSGIGYRPGTIEELLVEYERYCLIFACCPLFFIWIKKTLEDKGAKKGKTKA